MTTDPKKDLRQALALAIKTIRKSRNLTQEDFGLVSSRTYLSTLERGLKSPTLDKLDEIAKTMEVHPTVLVILAYAALEENIEVQACMVDEMCQEAKNLLFLLSTSNSSLRNKVKIVPKVPI